MLPLYGSGDALMSKAQRFRLGLLYGAMAVLGAAYGVYQQQRAIDWLTDSMKQVSLPLMKEMLPFSLLLILALMVYGLFRAAGSVFERLNGVSLAAHSTLHTNYGKARIQT
jgi:zinc transporter ZupT